MSKHHSPNQCHSHCLLRLFFIKHICVNSVNVRIWQYMIAILIYAHLIILFITMMGHINGLTSRTVGHISQPSEFKSQHGHVWRVFHLSLHLITFVGRWAHLVYLVHIMSMPNVLKLMGQTKLMAQTTYVGCINSELFISHYCSYQS